MRRFLLPLVALGFAASPTFAKTHLIEPHMHIVPVGAAPEVALTLDACMGAADMRIINALVDNQVPATIFATRRWLVHNPKVVRLLVSPADLYENEDKGAENIPDNNGTERQ